MINFCLNRIIHLGDLDYLASLKGVSVSWANSGGYHIVPGAEAAVDELKEKDFLSAS